jgi:hypothetical protein
MNRIPWSALILVCTAPAIMAAQSRIHGTVTDSSGVHLSGVRVAISGSQVAAVSDSAGAFVIRVDSLNSWLVFSKIGFSPDSLRVNVALRPEPLVVPLKRIATLKQIDVSARAIVPEKYRYTHRFDEFFYRRKQATGGNFFDADDIRKLGGVANAVRTVPSMRAGERQGRLAVASRRCPAGPAGGNMGLSINGVMRDISALDLIDVSQIELVEVYKGVSDTPPEMRGNNCGAIAIYTK